MEAAVNEIPRPDWVMFGTPWSGGKVALLASKELTEAELVREVEEITDWYDNPIREEPVRMELTVAMRTYTMVVADTYEQALKTLFDTWSPTQAAPKQISPTRQAIESRSY